ncbi:MAG: hypothetical protein K9K67_14955 [Bacteriovoracaceae bacterium]|nr:hypothetical protein [Bacteriovoracaceae bacterium]
MGLKERRALEEFKTQSYGNLLNQIKSAAQFEVEVEFNFESLEKNILPDYFAEHVTKVFFTPLINTLNSIAADELGATALKQSLKKIIIQDSNSIHISNQWASLKDGVLTLDHEVSTNVDQIVDRTESLTALLENNL